MKHILKTLSLIITVSITHNIYAMAVDNTQSGFNEAMDDTFGTSDAGKYIIQNTDYEESLLDDSRFSYGMFTFDKKIFDENNKKLKKENKNPLKEKDVFELITSDLIQGLNLQSVSVVPFMDKQEVVLNADNLSLPLGPSSFGPNIKELIIYNLKSAFPLGALQKMPHLKKLRIDFSEDASADAINIDALANHFLDHNSIREVTVNYKDVQLNFTGDNTDSHNPLDTTQEPVEQNDSDQEDLEEEEEEEEEVELPGVIEQEDNEPAIISDNTDSGFNTDTDTDTEDNDNITGGNE